MKASIRLPKFAQMEVEMECGGEKIIVLVKKKKKNYM